MEIQSVIFTIIWQHLLITSVFLLFLLLIFKLFSVSAEMKSWLWLFAIILSIAVPVVLSVRGAVEVAVLSAKPNFDVSGINEVTKQTTNISSVTQFLNTDLSNKTQPNNRLIFSFLVKLVKCLAVIFIMLSLFKIFKLMLLFLYGIKIKNNATEHYQDNVYFSNRIQVPSLIGFYQCKIVLPYSFNELSTKNKQFIIEHEKAHLVRKDNITSLVIRIINCLFWFNPVLHLMDRELKQVREIACDNRAIEKTALNENKNSDHIESIRIDYASMLIESVNSFYMDKQPGEFMTLLNRKKYFKKRITQILDNNKPSPLNKMSIVMLSASFLVVSSFAIAYNVNADKSVLKNINKIVLEAKVADLHAKVILNYDDVNLEKLIKNKNVILLVVADWCITCQMNLAEIQSEGMIEAAIKQNLVYVVADYTNPQHNEKHKQIQRLMSENDRRGLPMNIRYSVGNSKGVMVSPLIEHI